MVAAHPVAGKRKDADYRRYSHPSGRADLAASEDCTELGGGRAPAV